MICLKCNEKMFKTRNNQYWICEYCGHKIPEATAHITEQLTNSWRNIQQGDRYDVESQRDLAFARDQGTSVIIKNMEIKTSSNNDLEHLRACYLKELSVETRNLPWRRIDPEYANPSEDGIGLIDIFIGLDTTSVEKIQTEEPEEEYSIWKSIKKSERRVSVQEMVNREIRLVLLGDPGSGKSSIINYWTYVMAQSCLTESSCSLWLERLKEIGPWDHDSFLPVRVVLRELANHMENQQVRYGNSDVLKGYLKDFFRRSEFSGYWEEFYLNLLSDEKPYLILLDGLDEVPIGLRKMIVDTINDFSMKFNTHRYIVTCRTYAYSTNELRLYGFKQAMIKSFNKAQIDSFISIWYRQLYLRGYFSKHDFEKRVEQLKKATLSPDVIALAEKPLFLTSIAILHSFKGHLPDDKVELYQCILNLLLRRWQTKTNGENGLLELLNMPNIKMCDLEAGIYHVAFKAQSEIKEGETSCIPEEAVLKQLKTYVGSYDKAELFLKYIRDRAGLLISPKPEMYTFPHNTFQEFMAACHLAAVRDYPSESSKLVNENPIAWRNVFILAACKAPMMQGLLSVFAICPVSADETKQKKERDFIRAEIAGETLIKIGLTKVRQDDFGNALLERVKNWMTYAIQSDKILEPKKRVLLGDIMAQLDDPRFDRNMWFLPNDYMLGFVKIPSGEFMMGSDSSKDRMAFLSEIPQHKVFLSEYHIAKYPVTVAQFTSFVYDNGYFIDENDFKKFNQTNNHPVVGVTWHDASAYCEWLTEKLKNFGWKINLPTEAQWEKAAKGLDDRIYPGGDEFDYNMANYSHENRIGKTSAVGCFPGSKSPYSVMDMSGNVCEWCIDIYDPDYYKKSPIKNPCCSGTGSLRVIRGGSWASGSWNCRNACRYMHEEQQKREDIGFRIIAQRLSKEVEEEA